jgi:hypothetical protein
MSSFRSPKGTSCWVVPGGVSRRATLKRHVPYARREGVEHNVVKANPFDFTFIEIEH